jgi:hypothetical protein
VTSPCEHCKETSGAIKRLEFLEWLSNCWLVKADLYMRNTMAMYSYLYDYLSSYLREQQETYFSKVYHYMLGVLRVFNFKME